MVVQKDSKIVIVGAGCFGLSAAYHLLKRGYIDITVLDKSPILPAPEAASTDLNKVVRSSYSDVFYTRLAREAIATWKDREEWGDAYHESGVLVLLSDSEGDEPNASYSDKAFMNDTAEGALIDPLKSTEAIRAIFPPGVQTAFGEQCSGYLNKDGGWANASQGVVLILDKVKSMGGRVIPDKATISLLKEDGKTVGVICADGTVYNADLVVLSAGSWTASTFPELGLSSKCLSSGQCVAVISLSPEEAQSYKDCPVYLNFNTGFYIFPPNDQNLVKFAIHSGGFTHTVVSRTAAQQDAPVTAPVFPAAPNGQGSLIPKIALKEMREALAKVYPALATKPISWTRMCWYTDSSDDDWVIGFHPSDPNVMLATAGSGHAYKFLPVIGQLVADAVEGKMDPLLVRKFALDRPPSLATPSRHNYLARPLDLSQLCTAEDLLTV
ncbi:FAD dependent oxidoreductase [Obba rivulosa]|uniref:FAD dependent oxidoreductase n=1 Tax=Obba rivulosa TaxID=1052685 RepID=A0A8E2DJY3_9APHY|nr:FAD dependent oxidoreductase [Obba rivulosa]